MQGIAEAPLRVLFVCANDFGEASAKQALWLARELRVRGHAAQISVTGDATTVELERAGSGARVEVRAHRFVGPVLSRADVDAARTFGPDVIHCWSSRRAAVAVARRLCDVLRVPAVVHFEDDEWRIRADPMRRSVLRRALRPAKRAAAQLYPPLGVTMTRASERWVVQHAAGLDALTPALAEHVCRMTGRPCETILPVTPALDAAGAAGDGRGGRLLDRFDDVPVALWTGAVHPGIEADVRLAMEAVGRLQASGRDVVFAHVGSVLPRYDTAAWAREAGLREGSAAFLGYVPYPQVPGLLRSASVLLSPGHPSEYNRLRLPSKVQAYLASGTPTITYATGFGELLQDRREALLNRTGEPEEVAGLIEELLDDEQLRAALARGGPQAAARLFDADANVEAMARHYRRAIAGAVAAPQRRPAARTYA